jgi:hypothetical protein
MTNYPLNPMLLEPDILLSRCPAEKQTLARQVLARMALRNAFLKARSGYKADALLYSRTTSFIIIFCSSVCSSSSYCVSLMATGRYLFA